MSLQQIALVTDSFFLFFSAKLDGVKTYMRMRRVPNHLQVKVIKWFDYLWLTQKCSDEEKAVSCLPDKLKVKNPNFVQSNCFYESQKRIFIFVFVVSPFLCGPITDLRFKCYL